MSNRKVCFFGHKDAPRNVKPKLRDVMAGQHSPCLLSVRKENKQSHLTMQKFLTVNIMLLHLRHRLSHDIIHSVCSHGYGITVGCGVTIDVDMTHKTKKVLFAAHELAGRRKSA